MRIILLFAFVTKFSYASGQPVELPDSLMRIVDTTQGDSSKIILLSVEARKYLYKNPGMIEKLNMECVRISWPHCLMWAPSKSAFFPRRVAVALGNIGANYTIQGNYELALRYLDCYMRLARKIKQPREEATAHNYLGYTHAELANHRLAISHFKNGLEIARTIADTAIQIQLTTNIGAVMDEIADSARTKQDITTELVYRDSAMNYLNRSRILCEAIGNRSSLITILNNMAANLSERSISDSASAIGEQALQLAMELTNPMKIAESKYQLATVYANKGNYEKALEYGLSSFEISMQTKHLRNSQGVAQIISRCYENLGQFDLALKYFRIQSDQNDSMRRENNLMAGVTQELQETHDLQKACDSVISIHESQLKSAEIAKNATLMDEILTFNYSLYMLACAGVFMLTIIGIYIWRKKKAHALILAQKAEIDTQQEKIIQSITFAKEIQNRILPPLHSVREKLPGFNLLYSPCDIVSGDFYWFKTKEGCSYLALGDCTGHGVPGAFMSLMGTAMLNDILFRLHVNSPARMLELLDQKVRTTLKQTHPDASDEGMEIAVIKIDERQNRLTFAGASQHLFVLRETVDTIKAAMRGIGGFVRKPEKLPPFKDTEISLDSVKAVYLVTDGLEDQFNPRNGEKFGRHRVLECITGEYSQGKINQLRHELTNWISGARQIDDISLLEIKFQ